MVLADFKEHFTNAFMSGVLYTTMFELYELHSVGMSVRSLGHSRSYFKKTLAHNTSGCYQNLKYIILLNADTEIYVPVRTRV